MAHNDADSVSMPGGDSFLDVIANIVGILVLLVVVVGLRAARHVAAPPDVAQQVDATEIQQEAKRATQAAVAAARDAARLREQAMLAGVEAKRRDDIRGGLAVYNAKLAQELEDERAQLDDNTRRSLETRTRLAAARSQLDEATVRQVSLINAAVATPVEEIGFDTTPIVRQRVEQQLRLVVQGGAVAVLPMDDFEAAVSQTLSRINSKLEASPGEPVYYERLVGPFRGYSMRLLARQRIVAGPQGMSYGSEVIHGRLEQTGEPSFEPVQQATADGSRLATTLGRIDKQTTVVTLHAYPDSFDVTSSFKADLEARGYRVAVTPQTAGRPLTFSSRGRATVLQ